MTLWLLLWHLSKYCSCAQSALFIQQSQPSHRLRLSSQQYAWSLQVSLELLKVCVAPQVDSVNKFYVRHFQPLGYLLSDPATLCLQDFGNAEISLVLYVASAVQDQSRVLDFPRYAQFRRQCFPHTTDA